MSARVAARTLLVALLLTASSAQAQLFRAYLSGAGSDANPCTLQAPCRLLPAALAAVAANGEIWMLDSANYNTSTVNITKSVTILAVPGVVGSVVAVGGPAISVSSANITLRNLVLTPLAGGGGDFGIVMAAGVLVVENSLIANMPKSGISITTFQGSARIVNTIFRNNGEWGVDVEGAGVATLASSQLLDNGLGGVRASCGVSCAANFSSRVHLTDSVISGGAAGALAVNDGPAQARVSITRSAIEGTSGAALSVENSGSGAATIVINGTMLFGNGSPWNIAGAGAIIHTMQDNHVAENGPASGALTPTLLR